MEAYATGIEPMLVEVGEPRKILAYGTAGFRDKYDLPLDYVFLRMGVLAVLRSLSKHSKCVGTVITASHNAEIDNGLKLVDPNGGMLSQSWEPYAVTLANCSNASFLDECKKIVKSESLIIPEIAVAAMVMVGRDTRPHSVPFTELIKRSVGAMGGTCLDLGEVTTPILHFVVREINRIQGKPESSLTFDARRLKNIYFQTMTDGYVKLVNTCSANTISGTVFKKVENIILDASYGVGSVAVEQFSAYYNEQKRILEEGSSSSSRANPAGTASMPVLSIDIRNVARTGPVNEGCGAEHAQKLQQPPLGVSSSEDNDQLMCSFDGDGDRIVFHAFLDREWILLDGDKIAALMTTMIQQELSAAGLLGQFTFAVVQTAYANGASSQYISSLGVPIHITKTGVKYLHHKAQEFDIGIYFEANGHGTILFSESFCQTVHSYEPSSDPAQFRRNTAYLRLQASTTLINPAVGDALSDMLYCMAALHVLGIDLPGWHTMYTDLPSKQQKVAVPDKSLVSCSADETTILQPLQMQADLNAAMKRVSNGRCFVRPSGTEDVVRIYAEATTRQEADQLATYTYDVIRKHLG